MNKKPKKEWDELQLYGEIVEKMAEGVFLIRARDGMIIYANPAIGRMFGCTSEELLGKHISAVNPPTDKSPEEAAQEIIQDLCVSGVWQREIQNLKRDGTAFWCHAKVLASEHPQHENIWIAIYQDITKCKHAEYLARERTKELQGLYSLAEITEREGITLDKLYQGLTDILPKSWQYTEITCARIVMGDNEFRTKNFMESEWKQSAPVKVNGLVVGGIEVGYLEEMPEENEGPFLKEERLLLDTIAEQLGRITERKQAEQKIEHLNAELKKLLANQTMQLEAEITAHSEAIVALQESEDRFHVAQDISLDAFTILHSIRDEQGRIVDFVWTYANPAAGRILKHPPEELVGQRLLEILPGNLENKSLFERYVRIVETGQGDEVELEYHSEEISGWFRNMAVKLDDGVAISFSDITEHKRMEAALDASEKKFRALFEHASDGVTLVDAAGNIIFESPSIYRITGHAVEERSNMNSFEVLHPDDREAAQNTFGKLLQIPGSSETREFRVLHKDGSYRYMDCTATNLLDEPAIRAVVINFRDITERKQAETALQESEERYRILVEQSLMGIGVSQGNQVVFANLALLRIFGYDTLEEFARTPLLDHVAPSSREMIADLQRKTSQGEMLQNDFEYEIIRKDGKIRALHAYTSHFTSGNVIYTQTTFEDITESKRAEEELKESEEKFRLLAEQSPNMIFINRRGKVLYANKRCEEVMGYTRKEFYSADFDFVAITAPEYVNLVKTKFAQHMRNEEVAPYEYALITKDGKRIEAIISPRLINYRGESAILGIVTDISERKRAEEALRESEEKFRTLFETMAQGVVYQAANGEITSANPAAQRILGLTLEQMQGRTSDSTQWKAVQEDGSEFPGEMHPAMVALRTGQEIRNVIMGVFNPQTYERRWLNIHAVPQFRPGEETPYQVYTTFDDITGRKQAEDLLRQQNKYLIALQETMLELVSQLDLEILLGNIVRRAGQLIGTSSGFLDLVDLATGLLVPRIGIGAAESRQHLVRPGEGVAGVVWQTGKPFIVQDYDHWAGRVTSYPLGKLRSVMGVPLLSSGKVVGVLGQAYGLDTTETFSDEDVVVLEQFARMAAIVLVNASLFATAQQELAERRQAEERLREANKLLEEQLGEIKILRDYLHEQAVRDPLTGLYNRLYLYTTVERELARAKREKSSISVMMIDIDHFKAFNDTYGHQAGDKILVALGSLLHNSIRQGDIACRYGGEEFIIIMPGACEIDAQKRAETIRRDFNDLRINYDRKELSAAISLGLAFYPQHGGDMNQVIKAADTALYQAKQAGRNCVKTWSGG